MEPASTSAVGAAPATGTGGRSHRLRAGLQLVFVVAAFAALAWTLSREWPTIQDSLARLDAAVVAIVLVLGLVFLACSFVSWRAALTWLVGPVPVLPAARIFFVGQLGKYLPGSVWPLVAQMEFGRAIGLPRTRVVVASLLAIATSVLVGAAVGLSCLPFVEVPLSLRVLGPLLALIPLAALHPAVLNKVVGLGLRLTRRPSLPAPLPGRAIAVSAGASACAWVLGGVGSWVLATRLGAHGLWIFPLCLAAYSLAVTAGLLVVPVPAGAGVREGVFVLFLSLALATGPAMTVAIVSRLVLTVSDGVMAGAALLGSRALRLARPGSRATDDAPAPRSPARV